ncbi:hypothetical protein F5Y17DRAFT_461342 [Xylariaceae sp. FL0594]|nr:hypothetical protein F5Y17DRAFT_461342 [Xylariaceae sp. FL0594]
MSDEQELQKYIEEQWREASIQLDRATVMIKITKAWFDRLGFAGQEYFKTAFGAHHNNMPQYVPAEFMVDSDNPDRIYLSSRTIMVEWLKWKVKDVPGHPIPVVTTDLNRQNKSTRNRPNRRAKGKLATETENQSSAQTAEQPGSAQATAVAQGSQKNPGMPDPFQAQTHAQVMPAVRAGGSVRREVSAQAAVQNAEPFLTEEEQRMVANQLRGNTSAYGSTPRKVLTANNDQPRRCMASAPMPAQPPAASHDFRGDQGSHGNMASYNCPSSQFSNSQVMGRTAGHPSHSFHAPSQAQDTGRQQLPVVPTIPPGSQLPQVPRQPRALLPFPIVHMSQEQQRTVHQHSPFQRAQAFNQAQFSAPAANSAVSEQGGVTNDTIARSNGSQFYGPWTSAVQRSAHRSSFAGQSSPAAREPSRRSSIVAPTVAPKPFSLSPYLRQWESVGAAVRAKEAAKAAQQALPPLSVAGEPSSEAQEPSSPSSLAVHPSPGAQEYVLSSSVTESSSSGPFPSSSSTEESLPRLPTVGQSSSGSQEDFQGSSGPAESSSTGGQSHTQTPERGSDSTSTKGEAQGPPSEPSSDATVTGPASHDLPSGEVANENRNIISSVLGDLVDDDLGIFEEPEGGWQFE